MNQFIKCYLSEHDKETVVYINVKDISVLEPVGSVVFVYYNTTGRAIYHGTINQLIENGLQIVE